MPVLTIDSQVWVYYFDANAPENKNVSTWLAGEHDDGILFKEDILLSLIIPIEVGHNLFKLKSMNGEDIEQIMMDFLSIENCRFIDIDPVLAVEAFKILKSRAREGIGGRDALILATMDTHDVTTIATNDKNILTLTKYRRIDPVVDPPLIFEIGENFDQELFKKRISEM